MGTTTPSHESSQTTISPTPSPGFPLGGGNIAPNNAATHTPTIGESATHHDRKVTPKSAAMIRLGGSKSLNTGALFDPGESSPGRPKEAKATIPTYTPIHTGNVRQAVSVGQTGPI
ncbi:MAG: hypothetical protein K2Q20_13435, partial [Phycisphaerales bacterium]|nr:hypothetical protein [Phycisphaerales bacterium]